MDDVRCTVLSPLKYRGRVYRDGEVVLPAAIAAEQERGGSVRRAPVVDPATNTPQGEPALVDAGSPVSTTEPAGGTTPPAGEAVATATGTKTTKPKKAAK